MFRFSIRELVLLTLVVAMGVAWWIERARLAAQLAKYQQAEQRELDRQEHARVREQLFKEIHDNAMTILSDKAIREYGAPVPKPLPDDYPPP
jgi:streptomycin 6-kinase